MFPDLPSPIPIRGRQLRYLLLIILDQKRMVMTIPELAREVERRGFVIMGPVAKSISDRLGVEVGHNRVQRVGRGRYQARPMSRQLRWRLRRRMADYKAEYRRVEALPVSDLAPWHAVGQWFADDDRKAS